MSKKEIKKYLKELEKAYTKAEALIMIGDRKEAMNIMTPFILKWAEVKMERRTDENNAEDKEINELIAEATITIVDYQDMLGGVTVEKVEEPVNTDKEDIMSKKEEKPELEIVNEEETSKVKDTIDAAKDFVMSQKDCYKKSWFKYACGAVACVLCFFIGIMVGRD